MRRGSWVTVLSLLLLLCTAYSSQSRPVNVAMDRDLTEIDIPRLQAMYASGKYTVTQVTQWYLDRIARYDGVYNAVLHLDSAGALATAAAEDAAKKKAGTTFKPGVL